MAPPVAADDDIPPSPTHDPRTVALSDGVFSIAMTLLVLSIGVPHLGPGDRLGSALWDHRDEVLSWLLSFVVIGNSWIRHRALFGEVHHVDHTLTRLNLAYLAVIAFLPYPTELLGDYGHRPAAVCLYAATIVLLTALRGAMGRHAHRSGVLTAVGVARHAQQPEWWVVPAILLLAIPLAFPFGALALLVWLLLPLSRMIRR